MDADTYSFQTVVGGDAPVATIALLDGEGAPVAGAQVRVAFIRQVNLVGFVGNETVIATTGADGTVTVAAPTLSGLPGNYVVAAFALGTSGSDRYTVGA